MPEHYYTEMPTSAHDEREIALRALGNELTFVTDDLHESERAAANIVTEYERNFTEQGIKIHMLEARKG